MWFRKWILWLFEERVWSRWLRAMEVELFGVSDVCLVIEFCSRFQWISTFCVLTGNIWWWTIPWSKSFSRILIFSLQNISYTNLSGVYGFCRLAINIFWIRMPEFLLLVSVCVCFVNILWNSKNICRIGCVCEDFRGLRGLCVCFCLFDWYEDGNALLAAIRSQRVGGLVGAHQLACTK